MTLKVATTGIWSAAQAGGDDKRAAHAAAAIKRKVKRLTPSEVPSVVASQRR